MSWDDDVREPADGADFAHRLTTLCAELGTDELRVLVLVAERLAKGRQRYGELHIASDRRDFRIEAVEELADACVYLAADLYRGRT